MRQAEKARAFGALHVKGAPLVLYNIWDAGSARAVAESGARALATGSWSVAAAQGFDDGEALPLADLLRTARQIVAAVDLPVSVDFEGAYATTPETVAGNVRALIAAGAVGMNFEDRIVSGDGLHATEAQVAKIKAIRAVADAEGVPFFINARTDLFLQSEAAAHPGHVDAAIARGKAYADAGASGFFIPGLAAPDLIATICGAVDLPVNVMASPKTPPRADLASCGVARISHGPFPYRAAMRALTAAAQDADA